MLTELELLDDTEMLMVYDWVMGYIGTSSVTPHMMLQWITIRNARKRRLMGQLENADKYQLARMLTELELLDHVGLVVFYDWVHEKARATPDEMLQWMITKNVVS
jgi:hypothetical protein